MNRLVLGSLLLSVVALSGSVFSPTAETRAPQKEEAVVEFQQQVKLLGVFLRGEYLFVHDDEAMARGEDCTYVYSRRAGQPDRLITSFHCTPMARKTADHFTVRTARISGWIPISEIKEIQFAGSSEAHQVPTD